MIARIRLLLLLARPAVITLLMMFTATGLAQGGRAAGPFLLGGALLAVTAFLLFSVAWNDLADEAIDRVNLPGQRPLTTGAATRWEFIVIGVVSGVVALVAGASLGWHVLVVTSIGLVVSASYSVRPVRLADRGAIASMVLPACYVAVPYLIGLLAAGQRLTANDFAVAGGLYLGFIGRILLKDFRDVRGDALFGKRTFLVRHGRRATCAVSSVCFVAGNCVVVLAVRHTTGLLIGAEAVCLAGVLVALRLLGRDPGARQDEALISAVAVLGRGMVLLLLAHLSLVNAGWSWPRYATVLGLLTLGTLGQAARMALTGPATRLTVPGWLASGADGGLPAEAAEEAPAGLA